MTTPPTPRPPIETKVKAATVGAFLLAAGGIEVITLLSETPGLIGFLPDWIEPFVIAVLPALGAAAAGYRAKHTPRTDPAAQAK